MFRSVSSKCVEVWKYGRHMEGEIERVGVYVIRLRTLSLLENALNCATATGTGHLHTQKNKSARNGKTMQRVVYATRHEP